jgi:hypothetical protein
MKQLSISEIYRTSFKYLRRDLWKSPYGYYMNRDPNEMCPYCKNEDTNIVRNTVDLQLFKEFYSSVEIPNYIVVECDCCTAVWSFYLA